MRGQNERRWTPTTKPYRDKTHPIVGFLEDQGFERVGAQVGERREMRKGDYPKVILHFYERTFIGAVIHLAADRNIGHVTPAQLKAFFGEGLCLREHEEPWEFGRTHYCKRPPNHEGACMDDDGLFPAEVAS